MLAASKEIEDFRVEYITNGRKDPNGKIESEVVKRQSPRGEALESLPGLGSLNEFVRFAAGMLLISAMQWYTPCRIHSYERGDDGSGMGTEAN